MKELINIRTFEEMCRMLDDGYVFLFCYMNDTYCLKEDSGWISPDGKYMVHSSMVSREAFRQAFPVSVLYIIHNPNPPLTNRQVFDMFLTHIKGKEQYYRLLAEHGHRYFSNRPDVNAAIDQFSWSYADRGTNWTNVNTKWCKLCEHFNLKGNLDD